MGEQGQREQVTVRGGFDNSELRDEELRAGTVGPQCSGIQSRLLDGQVTFGSFASTASVVVLTY